MDRATGSVKLSWQPVMTAHTATLDYWLHWRVLLCAFWVVFSMAVASFFIWKYEGSSIRERQREETNRDMMGSLYGDESWKPCLKDIHPVWLLVFRIVAFFVMSTLLVVNIVVDGGGIFYFYTQWTFTLVTMYFALGSLLSTYGCYSYLNRIATDKANCVTLDQERGTCVASTHVGNVNTRCITKSSTCQEQYIRQKAGIWSYVFQIIYQTSAGAVMLTDCVFWLVIVPFLTAKDYTLNLLMVGMHSINVVFLIGDTAFNCLRFPWFRIAYFIMWTAIFVIFQWIIHACVSIWYLSLGLMLIPCYGIFCLIIKMKHYLFSKWFPQSYQCSK